MLKIIHNYPTLGLALRSLLDYAGCRPALLCDSFVGDGQGGTFAVPSTADLQRELIHTIDHGAFL
jgi:hypothetical protein